MRRFASGIDLAGVDHVHLYDAAPFIQGSHYFQDAALVCFSLTRLLDYLFQYCEQFPNMGICGNVVEDDLPVAVPLGDDETIISAADYSTWQQNVRTLLALPTRDLQPFSCGVDCFRSSGTLVYSQFSV